MGGPGPTSYEGEAVHGSVHALGAADVWRHQPLWASRHLEQGLKEAQLCPPKFHHWLHHEALDSRLLLLKFMFSY